MLRRRILGGFFKFNIAPTSLSFDYGIQKTLTEESWLYESGTVVGTTTVVTKNNKFYYKLAGRGEGTPNIAFVNFKTYTNNQVIQLDLIVSSESPNDFLGICKLDTTDENPLLKKMSGTTDDIINITVPTAGSHFIKVYYYQHNDGVTSGDNAGYIRLVPYYNQYEYGYDAPATQTLKIKSYTGWTLVSKPAWVALSKSEDRAGSKSVVVSVQGNAGAARSGNIIFKEKKNDTSITVSVSQGANPHPNDIILSLEKSGIVNAANSSVGIDVSLIGNTSYTISNLSSNNYTVSPMSGNADRITVTKTTANNTSSSVSFRMTGNAGTIKDVTIVEDDIYCYCDCNQYDKCQCHVNTTFVRQEISGSTSPCDKHCAAYGTACASHVVCVCDCNQNNTCDTKCADCICNNDSTCSGHCNDSCNCYTQCSNCAGHCNDSCNCYTQCSNCAGHCSNTTSACNCDCNTQGTTVKDSCQCDCNTYNTTTKDSCQCDCNNHTRTTKDSCQCDCNNHTRTYKDDCYCDCNNDGTYCTCDGDGCNNSQYSTCKSYYKDDPRYCLCESWTGCGCHGYAACTCHTQSCECKENNYSSGYCYSNTCADNHYNGSCTAECADCKDWHCYCDSQTSGSGDSCRYKTCGHNCLPYDQYNNSSCNGEHANWKCIDYREQCASHSDCSCDCTGHDPCGCDCNAVTNDDCLTHDYNYEGGCVCFCNAERKCICDATCDPDCTDRGYVGCSCNDVCSCDCNVVGCSPDCNDSCNCYTQCSNCAGHCGDSCNCYTQCSNCGGHCNDSCNCYTQCSNCAGHCSDSCNCYTQCSNCAGHCNDSCNCYTQCSNCAGHCSDSCNCYTQCSNCGGHCSNARTGCNCDCNTQGTTVKDSCQCDCNTHNTTVKDSCQCDCNTYNTVCPSYDACTCNTNVGNCTAHLCQSKVDTCSCNEKTYYPHCDCDQYCPCQGYVIPQVG